MTDYDNTTSVLSISSKKINNCQEVVDLLFKLKVACKVSSNNTVLRNPQNNQYSLEKGCTITFAGLKPELIKTKVWNPLQQQFDLQCAHLDILGKYKGCIYNYINKSSCPVKKI